MERSFLNPPSLISIPNATIPLLGDVYTSAAEFYRLVPWQLFRDETPIEIRYPHDALSRVVVITGAGGDAPGFSAYDSPEDLNRMYAAANPLVAGRELNWLSLTYDTDAYIASDDLKAIEQYGWPVVNEGAYPGIFRLGSPGADMYSPTIEDIYWLAGTIPTLVAYFQNHFKLNGWQDSGKAAFELEINTRDDQEKVYLRIPASGITFPPGV
jgi:hypothetical protein